jgi:hypothetical protein
MGKDTYLMPIHFYFEMVLHQCRKVCMSFWLPGLKPDIMASFHCPRFKQPAETISRFQTIAKEKPICPRETLPWM